MENEVIPDLDVETQREVAIEMEMDVSPSSVTPICTSPAPVQSTTTNREPTGIDLLHLSSAILIGSISI